MDYDFFNKWAPIFMERLMKDFNLNVLEAAAVIGNAGHESGGFKSLQEKKPLVPGSRGGYGIMQWTGPRRRQYESYCERNDLDPADMESNYKFLFVELMGPEGRVIKRLKDVKTLDQKVEIFMKTFLRPGIPHLNSRKVWARRAIDAFNAYDKIKNPVKKPEVKTPVSDEPWWFRLLRLLIKGFKR